MQLDDCLLTHAVIVPEMNASDIEAEIKKMFLANHYVQLFYKKLKEGTIDRGFNEEFADALCECEIEPYSWLENSQENAKYLLLNGVYYEL